MIKKLTLPLLGVIFFIGCPGSVHRPIRGVGPLALPGHTVRLVEDAPIVVVATTLSVSSVGAVFATGDSRQYPVQLNRLRVSVEDVWRGSVPLGATDVFCYSYSRDHASPDGKHIEKSDSTGRRIYFLDTEQDELRCFLDIYESSIRVFTGRHPQSKATTNSEGPNLRQMVADILLTPGEKPELDAFASYGGIGTATNLSRDLVGLTSTMRLLWPLQSHPSSKVRDQACVALATSFKGQDECADDLIKQTGQDPLWKSELERIVANRKKRDQEIIDGLKTRPLWLWLYAEAGSLDPSDFRLSLTYHRNRAIRQLACAKLPRSFGESGCASGK